MYLIRVLPRPVERRCGGLCERHVGDLLLVEFAGLEGLFAAGDVHRSHPLGVGDDVEGQPVVIARQDVEIGLEVAGRGSRGGIEREGDDVRPSVGVECHAGAHVRDVEIEALGRKQLFGVGRCQQDAAHLFPGVAAALDREVEDRGEAVEAELDWLAFVGFAAFGVAEAEHLGHEGVRCAVVGVAQLGAQVAEGNGGRLSADCGVRIEGQVLPVSGAGGQLAFEGELIAVENESPGIRRKFGASGDGEEHAHGVAVLPRSGEGRSVDLDIGAAVLVDDRFGVDFYKRVVAGRRRSAGFVAVTACEQCGGDR